MAQALSSLRDRCAGGFELFRQLPEVSLRRGVSRFMQNGTQLPRELAGNAVRPSTLYAITRARFVSRQAPRCQPLPPSDFFLRVGTRESSIGPGWGPPSPRYSHTTSFDNLEPAAPRRRLSRNAFSSSLVFGHRNSSGQVRTNGNYAFRRRSSSTGASWINSKGRDSEFTQRSRRWKIAQRSKGVGINRHLGAG